MPIDGVSTSPHGDNATKWSELEDHLRVLPAKSAVAALAALLEDIGDRLGVLEAAPLADIQGRLDALEAAPKTKAARAGLETR